VRPNASGLVPTAGPAVDYGAGSPMTREPGRRRAAVLLILSVVFWFHAWFPALLVVAFVVWALLHKRLEGDLGQDLLPLWRRVWPPTPLVLVPLLVAATVAYWVSDQPMLRRAIPLTLNLFALSMILFGSGWRLVPQYRRRELRAISEAARSPSG
jgi:hypothetical protein